MQQGSKGVGKGPPGASRGAADKRRRAGPAHPGGRGPRLRSQANFAKRAGGAPGPAQPGPQETRWDPRGSRQAGTAGGRAACLRGKGGRTHHGSNSWMMLSKRMTAKRRELKPASQARKRMVKESNDCHPAGCDKPPDSPAGGPGFGAAAAAAALDALWVPGPWCPWRLFPRAMRPLHGDELRDDLCLLSGAEGSAMLCPGGGSRSSSAATAAAWSEGCWAETQRRRRRRRATATTTRRRRRRRRKSWARSRPQHREAGTLGVEAAAAAAIRSLRFSSGRDRRGLNPKGLCAPLAIRVPRAAEEAAVAARADGTRAPEERRLRAAMTFPHPPRREEHKGGGAPWSPGGAQATFDSAPSPNRNWPLRLSQSDRSVKGRGRGGGVRQ